MPKYGKRQTRQEAKAVLHELVETVVQEQEAIGEERIPGQVVRGLKTPWTVRDIEARFPIVSFLPEETATITYNGVRYQFLADKEMHVPSIIRDTYLDSRRRTRAVGKELRALGIQVEAGVGGLPPS